jgi:hypothetical protein
LEANSVLAEAKSTTIEPLVRGLPVRAGLLEEIDTYAHRHGLRFAEAVWCLIDAGLAAEGEAMLRYDRERLAASA